MIRLTDITFHANSEYADTDALLEAQQASLLYVNGLKDKVDLEVIKHITGNNTRIIQRENTRFFISQNKPGYIPRATIDHLKKNKPDIVFVHGLIFPLHIIRLRMILGRKVKIVVWHHADRPQGSLRKIFQRLADQCIERYLFTSSENAKEWVDAGIISSRKKIAEIPSTLTVFSKQDKERSKQVLQLGSGTHYLWVGRLDKVKDPMTVLSGFEKFISTMPSATLHLIYQSGELVDFVESYLDKKNGLRNHIISHGKVPHEELEIWYSAADFLISGSRSEGGSVVVIEAMACGCIPVVTAIPASMKVTGSGKYGFFYEVGNADGLAAVLAESVAIDRTSLSAEIKLHFENEYSVRAVAGKLYTLCRQLTGK